MPESSFEQLSPFESQREAFCERLGLNNQYEIQKKILSEVGILEILPESHSFGIVGIDGKEYPFPKYKEILERITPVPRQ